ncbi:hypothetical protein DRO54_11860 [Candidatus Bathyarchaeota archaeon]|nr:MAG: hypothetical protein DRO54_11860 [Candidatus Bathyarchaeota archaeon]
MKIAIVYSHLKEHGGAENVILKQTEMLNWRGYKAKCFFAYVDEKFELKTNPHCYIDTYFDKLPESQTVRILASIPLAPATVKSLGESNILICHGYGPSTWIGYTLKKLRRIKYISYIHSPPRFLYLPRSERKLWRFNGTRNIIYFLGNLTQPIFKLIDFKSVSCSDFVLANSQFTARRIKSIYGVDAEVCYPPIDTEVFKPIDRSVEDCFHDFFGRPFILSGGRIAAVKRWEWLIEMMYYVKKEFPEAVLAITGEISKENLNYVRWLIRKAKKLNVEENVKFFGFKPLKELVELYSAADVYVYSVPKEDFGLCPVEAMACGTPAVVWNDGGGPCETVLDGKTGFKAEPYDIEDLAEKTLKAISYFDKEKTRKFLPEYVKMRFSKEKHLGKLERIIMKVAAG